MTTDLEAARAAKLRRAVVLVQDLIVTALTALNEAQRELVAILSELTDMSEREDGTHAK